MEAADTVTALNRTTRRHIVRLCRPFLESAVRRLDADRDVKTYHTVGFAIAWICMTLMALPSIRRLRDAIDSNEVIAELIGWKSHISVAQSGRLQHCRPVEIWGDLIGALLARARQCTSGSNLRAMDTSFFASSLKLLSRQYPTKAMDKATAGFKMGTIIDPDTGMPDILAFRVGQDSDSGWVDTLVPDDEIVQDQTYTFDRGFRKYAFFDRIIEAGAHFVTRATALITYRDGQPRPLDPEHPDILSDDIVLLGSKTARNRMRNPVRRIVIRNTSKRATSKDKEIVLLASDLDSPAHELAELYRRRWDIEIFFRWLKRTIGAADVPGYTMEAAVHWLCACLVTYLISLICHRAATGKHGKDALVGLTSAVDRIRFALDCQPPRELRQPLEDLLIAMLLRAQDTTDQQPNCIKVTCQSPDLLPKPKARKA